MINSAGKSLSWVLERMFLILYILLPDSYKISLDAIIPNYN